jgi:hypothetical protein
MVEKFKIDIQRLGINKMTIENWIELKTYLKYINEKTKVINKIKKVLNTIDQAVEEYAKVHPQEAREYDEFFKIIKTKSKPRMVDVSKITVDKYPELFKKEVTTRWILDSEKLNKYTGNLPLTEAELEAEKVQVRRSNIKEKVEKKYREIQNEKKQIN